MTLSARQLERIANIQNMIDFNLERKKLGWFKPDRTVFRKVEKYMTVWAQNTHNKSMLDEELEINTMLYNLTKMAQSKSDLFKSLEITKQYDMISCQCSILRGIIDNCLNNRPSTQWNILQRDLIPEAYSYWVMIRD